MAPSSPNGAHHGCQLSSNHARHRAAGCSPPRQALTIALTAVAFFMVVLDALVVVTALPSIHRSLGGSLGTLQWTVNAYNMAFGAGIITAAALGDRLGRRRVYTAGLALFTVASAACALAPDVGLLITARAVQGLGAVRPWRPRPGSPSSAPRRPSRSAGAQRPQDLFRAGAGEVREVRPAGHARPAGHPAGPPPRPSRTADAVSFSRLFIANPDLVSRFALGHELATGDRSTHYSGGARGYVDYPIWPGQAAFPGEMCRLRQIAM